MAKTTPRLYADLQLTSGAILRLSEEASHYLRNVLRLTGGDTVRIFNGRDGEWLCYITEASKKGVDVRCERALADAKPPPDIDYVFAPLKHARLDYVVQKATELGVRRLLPVITRRTITERVNIERMRANAIEAAEQCNLVFVPEVLEPQPLERLIASWPAGRSLVYCDETLVGENPLAALAKLSAPSAVLIGPEGGFAPEEKQLLSRQSFVRPISLGPRIMRADTAAIAALTLVQAAAGDWGT